MENDSLRKKIRILYVDDYDLDRELVKDALEREHGGFEIREAANGEEFRALLDRYRFDVVLSDFNIAGFDGLQVIEEVKAFDPDLPVIIVTGTGSEEIAVKALKEGASDYVIKRPHHIRKLPQTILSILDKQRLILEQRAAERNLMQHSEFLDILLDTIPSPIFYKSRDGKYMLINKAFEEFYEIEKSKMIGKTVFDIAPAHIAQKYYEKDEELFTCLGTQSYQWKVVKASGQERDVIFNKATITSPDGETAGIIGTISDITDRIKYELELKENQLEIQDLYDNAPDMYVSVDAKTACITQCNQTLANKMGYTKDEIIGSPIFAMYHPDSLEGAEKAFKTFQKAGVVHNAELQLQRKNGSRIDVILNVSAVRDDQGNILQSRSAWRDVSEYKRVEREKEKLESQLRQTRKLESIGNLAGGIAHDFNNILTAILGFTELALGDVEKGSLLEDNLREVYYAGKRAKDLVKQILTFARQSDEKRKPVEIANIATEALKFIRSSIPTTIEIVQNIETNSLVIGNPTQIYQVFINLCTNASYAMEEKGGILEVNLRDTKISSAEETIELGLCQGEYVVISVSDTGIGISSDTIEKIFEPYFTSKPPGEGTGMGLAMVHGIIESYGGRICVESSVGVGTQFRVYLPVTLNREERVTPEIAPLPGGTERILFVDDEPSILKVGKRLLEHLGYSVTSCSSSKKALDLFSETPANFDLVITDMTMPEMTGELLAAELMKIRHNLPIVMLTGYSNKMSEEISSHMGIRAFAYKPIAIADLAETIRNVLDNSGRKD